MINTYFTINNFEGLTKKTYNSPQSFVLFSITSKQVKSNTWVL